MESQPQNPEFRKNPDYFLPWDYLCNFLKKIWPIVLTRKSIKVFNGN